MRKQGLNDDCLKILFHAIILSKVLYVLSAWGGYISKDNIRHVYKLQRKAKRYNFINTLLTFPELMVMINSYFHVLFVPTLCSKCSSDPKVILLIYLAINATSPGSLLLFEICI